MVDIQQTQTANSPAARAIAAMPARRIGIIGLALLAALLSVWQFSAVSRLSPSSDLFLDSTLGELAVWMADQATEDAPESWLGQLAQGRLQTVGEDAIEGALLADMYRLLRVWAGFAVGLVVLSTVGLLFDVPGHRFSFLAALVMTNTLIYIIPPTDASPLVSLLLVSIVTISLLLLLERDHVEKFIGFMVVLSLFTVAWEGAKAVSNSLGYAVTAPAAAWVYTAYDDLDGVLTALQRGEIDAVLADRRDLDEIMPPHPPDPEINAEDLAYADLVYLTEFDRTRQQFGREVEPEFPGRLSVAVTADAASAITSTRQLQAVQLGTVSGSFAEEELLALEQRVILLDLGITNDLNLPHLQSIAEALLQPARRNGPLLLVRILYGAALYTWTEAILGFVFGATLGFLLGTMFAHVALLQRSLLPYVVASQTVPIIAIAPMIVIWLRDTHPILPVAVISSYLTFFPVTINTLRGLQSPDHLSFDLMKSYAASPWQVMWKLRFPAALPYIFTALKVSATASVVGAIIGELPSGVRNGLGRAILDFSSDYSLISTPKLWGAIFMAALLGITFYLIVTVIEFVVLRAQRDPA